MRSRRFAAMTGLCAAWALALPAAALAEAGRTCSRGPGWFAWLLTLGAIVGAALYVKGAADRNTELLLTIDDDVRGLLAKVSRMEAARAEGADAPPPEEPPAAPASRKAKAAPNPKRRKA